MNTITADQARDNNQKFLYDQKYQQARAREAALARILTRVHETSSTSSSTDIDVSDLESALASQLKRELKDRGFQVQKLKDGQDLVEQKYILRISWK